MKIYCDNCNGTGNKTTQRGDVSNHYVHTEVCKVCNGKGYIVKIDK